MTVRELVKALVEAMEDDPELGTAQVYRGSPQAPGVAGGFGADISNRPITAIDVSARSAGIVVLR